MPGRIQEFATHLTLGIGKMNLLMAFELFRDYFAMRIIELLCHGIVRYEVFCRVLANAFIRS
jgi:hypothetical protein